MRILNRARPLAALPRCLFSPLALCLAVSMSLSLTACQDSGGKPGFYNDQGIEALSQDRYEEARLNFEKALELNPRDGVVWGNLGVALTRLERYPDALNAYRKSNEMAPGEAVTVAEMAAIQYRLRAFDQAEEGFREALKLESRAPEFHSSLALALRQQGKLEDARAEMDLALPQAARRGLVGYQYAAFLILEGKTDAALEQFKQSLRGHPAGARDSVGDPDFESLHGDPRYQELVKDWWKQGG
ncbi:MAG: tetratricopeptide repeat protein [Nitrospirota bacterium]|nr:tetratricopeptide repeat protein [Nitrospirota bacterium]